MTQRSGRDWRRKVRIIRARAEECWRCHRPLDPTATWPSPHFPTVGHLTAVEDGGTDDLNNLAPECIKCNMGDGANRTNRKRTGDQPRIWTNGNW